MLIDWLRIFQLSGWRTGRSAVAAAPQSRTATRMVVNLAAYRAALKAAAALGEALAALFTAAPGAPPPTTT
jgi:NAD/NADP transhydrogenase alpha subunit